MVESKGSMMIATSKTNLVTCVITVNNMQKLVYASVGRATAVRQLCDSCGVEGFSFRSCAAHLVLQCFRLT